MFVNHTLFAVAALVCSLAVAGQAFSQSSPLGTESKVKNYLPHMTWPEVEALAQRTDMVIIPVGALEQHGHHLPIGTDILNGIERAKTHSTENGRPRCADSAPGELSVSSRFPRDYHAVLGDYPECVR